MTTVAELGVKIVQQGLAETNQKLGELEKKAGETGKAVDQLARQSQAGFAGLARAANQAHDALHGLAAMAGTLVGRFINIMAGFFSIREYQRLADAWSDLSARVQNAIGPHEKAADVMRRLGKMAAVSYSDLGITAEAFINNSQSLQELGLSTEQQLKYQESLNNALVISGARADRAASVQHAFGAALALGALRGDQLNSVLINGDRIAKSLAKELGTTTNQLRQLGAEGKITREVMLRAMINDFQILQDEAKEMPATIQDGFMLIRNAAMILVGTFDKANGFSLMVATGLEKVSEAMIWLADNLQVVNGILAATATLIIARFVPGLWAIAYELTRQSLMVLLYGTRWLITAGQMKIGEGAALSLSRALGVLKGALIATGIGAIAVAVGWLTTQFSQLAVAAGGWGNAFEIARAVAEEQIGLIKEAMNYLPLVWEVVWRSIETAVSRVMQYIVNRVVEEIRNVIVAFNAIKEGVKAGWQALMNNWNVTLNNMVAAAVRAAAEIARILGNLFDMVKGKFTLANILRGQAEPGSIAEKMLGGLGVNMDDPIPAGTGDKWAADIIALKPKIENGMQDVAAAGIDAFQKEWQNGQSTALQGAVDFARDRAEGAAKGLARAASVVGTTVADIWRGNTPLLDAAREMIKGVGQSATDAQQPVAELGNALDGLAGAGAGGAGGGAGGGAKGGGGKAAKSDAQRLLEKQKDALKSLHEEVERYRVTVGMTALEEEIWNKQKETGALLNPQLAASVAAAVTEMDRLRERQAAMRSMADTIESAFGSAFNTIVTGAGSAKQALSQLLASLAKMFADRAFQLLWNGGGGGGGFGGWLVKGIQALAGFGGGGARVSAWRPEMNANGTPFFQGGLTSINERGGEIVDLPRGSRIYPADVTRRMAERENKGIDGKITIEINPSGEFTTEMDTRALSAAVNVVSTYNKSSLNNKTIRKTIRRPRSIG